MNLEALGAELPLELTAEGKPALRCPLHGTLAPLAALLDGMGSLPCGCPRNDVLAVYAEQSPLLAQWLKHGDESVLGATPKHTDAPATGEGTEASVRSNKEQKQPRSENNGNGAGGQLQQYPEVSQWKNVLYFRGMNVAEKTINDYEDGRQLVANMEFETWLATVRSLRGQPNPQDSLTWDPALSEAEIQEELESVARALVKKYGTVGVNGDEHHQADPYANQHAIDLYAAFTAARVEAREEFWGGLGRRGRSIVITGTMGSGKTTLLTCFARCAGLPYREQFLDRYVPYSKTLVVCSSKEIEAWQDAVGFYELQNTIFAIEAAKVQYNDRRKQVDWLVAEMTRLETHLLILDTMFDFFGMPPNTSGDINRIVMAEQAPLLEAVRARGYGVIVSGHPPKGEAQNPNPRDPEEAFGGASAWTAQHRMRMRYRRTLGPPALMTGKGGYGDKPIFPEQAIIFDENTRLVCLGGDWKNHMGVVALPVVLEILKDLGGTVSMSKFVQQSGKSEAFIRAGCRAGADAMPKKVWRSGKGRSTKYHNFDPEKEVQSRML